MYAIDKSILGSALRMLPARRPLPTMLIPAMRLVFGTHHCAQPLKLLAVENPPQPHLRIQVAGKHLLLKRQNLGSSRRHSAHVQVVGRVQGMKLAKQFKEPCVPRIPRLACLRKQVLYGALLRGGDANSLLPEVMQCVLGACGRRNQGECYEYPAGQPSNQLVTLPAEQELCLNAALSAGIRHKPVQLVVRHLLNRRDEARNMLFVHSAAGALAAGHLRGLTVQR